MKSFLVLIEIRDIEVGDTIVAYKTIIVEAKSEKDVYLFFSENTIDTSEFEGYEWKIGFIKDLSTIQVFKDNGKAVTKSNESVIVEMTDKQYTDMTLLALKAGFNGTGELLGSFTGDLTGLNRNGSDESDMADGWYDRAFGLWTETKFYFRYHLYNYDVDINDLAEDEDYFAEVYDEYLVQEPYKEHESKEECIAIVKELQKNS